MRVVIACPHPRGSRSGNRRTAERWARLLRELGHRVRVVQTTSTACGGDVLIALHAKHSAGYVRASRAAYPDMPIVLALTGTDLSHDIRVDPEARGTLRFADRIVVLHELADREVPARFRGIVRVVRQSAEAPTRMPRPKRDVFEVAVVGHLRAVKDPFRTAAAVRLLPAASHVHVVHAGRALDPSAARDARRMSKHQERYAWVGEVSPSKAREIIARARLFVLSSIAEGGANVLGEAIVCGTPVLASNIPAARAALGGGYPGLFPVGNEQRLAALILRAERDAEWLALLERHIETRRRLFLPRSEKRALKGLLAELRRGRR